MKATLTPTLSIEERKQLAALEVIIGQGVTAFTAVGEALAEIRDSRLYRDTHRTFESYCQQRWGFGRAHGHRLIEAAKVAADLSPIGDISRESHARELASFPPHLRSPIYQAVLDSVDGDAGRITAGLIERTGRAVLDALIASAKAAKADPDDEDDDDEDSLESGESDSLDSAGQVLAAAARRVTRVPLHPILKAVDHSRKLGKDLRHATDLDNAEALRRWELLDVELQRLAAEVKARK